ncbi:MAG: TlpA family protein disulfide reductase [Aquabacterium sp.]|uniref:TlpA family protein disulfide reductase n=1 Tax=Aquabacterium sp. TaxID=1872578 RepID=UPI001219D44A|nr:TlpA disulfide reductase family protein [Aquabacterium sp.]TAK96153.1 MAG: TlpA family protein disulfide reductase [Aquabacterium sp.]
MYPFSTSRLIHWFRYTLMATMAGLALQAAASVQVASAAPDFTLHAMKGPNTRLQELRGRVVLVNFWATWCGPCRQEIPHLNRLHEKYKRAGLVLLGVNVDDDPANAAAVAAKLDIQFPVLMDTDKKVSDQYDLQAMPSTYLIDRDGKVRYVHRGYLDGYEALYDKQIRELLK